MQLLYYLILLNEAKMENTQTENTTTTTTKPLPYWLELAFSKASPCWTAEQPPPPSCPFSLDSVVPLWGSLFLSPFYKLFGLTILWINGLISLLGETDSGKGMVPPGVTDPTTPKDVTHSQKQGYPGSGPVGPRGAGWKWPLQGVFMILEVCFNFKFCMTFLYHCQNFKLTVNL